MRIASCTTPGVCHVVAEDKAETGQEYARSIAEGRKEQGKGCVGPTKAPLSAAVGFEAPAVIANPRAQGCGSQEGGTSGYSLHAKILS